MIKKPILSVITPVYNGEQFIKRCYHNLLHQTFTDWEWIVVNDGSTDGTVKAVKIISDNRIRLFSYKPNKGRGFARSKALNESRGEWIVVWDVDDICFPDRLEVINKARIENYDFFCSYTVVIDNDINIKGIRGFSNVSNGLPRGFVHHTMACRTGIVKEIGYKSNIRTGEDAKILWVLPLKYRGFWFDDVLTIYQEDREVNLWKAIDCNLGHLSQLKELFNEGIVSGVKNYSLIYIRYFFKLFILNIMRIYPPCYLKLVNFRNFGETKIGWNLSKSRINFIRSLKYNSI